MPASNENPVCTTKVCLSSTHHLQTIPFSSSYFSHVRGPYLLVLPRITGSFWGFFVLFSSATLESDQKCFRILAAISLPDYFLNLLGEHPLSAGKVRENKSLATSLSTWQTKDYYFNGKFYLETLTPRKHGGGTCFLYFKYIFLKWYYDQKRPKK